MLDRSEEDTTRGMSRRDCLKTVLLGTAALSAGLSYQAFAADKPKANAPITVAPLPYMQEALAPEISKKTMEYHYGKHHIGYANKLNAQIVGTPLATLPLAAILQRTQQDPDKVEIYQNAAQVWNHTFYWRSLKPGGSLPPTRTRHLVDDAFGSLDNCKKALHAAGMSQFGSGWLWLLYKNGKLAIETTANAQNPLGSKGTPLLTIDLWEHAYYLDYQNQRGDYLGAIIHKLLNWDFAEKNLPQSVPA